MKRNFNDCDGDSSDNDPSDAEIEKCASEYRRIGLSYLIKCQCPSEEAHDIVGKYFRRSTSYSAADGRLLILPMGLYIFRLRQVWSNYIQYKNAPIRGGNIDHVTTDGIEDYRMPSSICTRQIPKGLDALKLVEAQLIKIERRCNPTQEILRKVMLRLVGECDDSFDHICDKLTQKEQSEFLGGNQHHSRDQLRRKVNRVRNEIKELIAYAHRFWLN